MICNIIILLSGWCRTRMRPARLVSYAFLYTTYIGYKLVFNCSSTVKNEEIFDTDKESKVLKTVPKR